jgi:hypothetical protein
MSKNYSQRLSNLKARRQGLDSATSYFTESVQDRARKVERYENRSGVESIRYVLGAMQEVDQAYTQKGRDEALRVGSSLQSGLAAHNIAIELRLQGSVPLNVHTRGASDVDLLALHAGFLTYDRSGALAGTYYPASGTCADLMSELRQKSEEVLTTRFWGAEVDIAGPKAIKMSGGSLVRTVDVVPAHWFDSVAYQLGGNLHDRGVDIWNKDTWATIRNMPFMHIKRITDKCDATLGGCRKTIRLVKNIKNDAQAEGTRIELSSYEVAGAMWHCDSGLLTRMPHYELGLLDVTQRHLEYLSGNHTVARTLMTPDGSRLIFDTEQKLRALDSLAAEVTTVHEDVGKELTSAANHLYGLDRQAIRRALSDSYIAA